MSVATKLGSTQETVYLPSDFEKLKAILTKLQSSYVDQFVFAKLIDPTRLS